MPSRILALIVAAGVVVLSARGQSPAAGEEKKGPEGKRAAADETVPRKQEARTITFSGQTWRVKNGRRLGPGPNAWSDSEKNVWLDDKGQLHMAIVQTGDRWDCAEVVAAKSLGYGEYRWVIAGSLWAFDPRVVLGLFLYENDRREIDFELARWADARSPNAQFVVQPGGKDSVYRFDSGKASVLTVSLLWEKTKIRGRCWVGEDTAQAPLADWEYTGKKIPPAGRERVDVNLWLYQGVAPSATAAQEIVIRTFRFQPAGETPPDRGQAELRVSVLDRQTRQPVACTVTLVDANGQTATAGEGLRGAFRSSGVFTRLLPPGRTKIRVTRGPEFKAAEKEIDLRAHERSDIQVELERQVDLRRRGWFAGDSHVHMIHGERTIAVDFDQVALAARAEDLQYLSLAQTWQLDDPTPERLEAELARRSTPDCVLTWNLEEPKNYYKGDAGRCLGHCWTLGMRGRTPEGANVIEMLLQASAGDYQSQKPSFANFESHALVHGQGGAVFYTHPARWWTGAWGGQGGYPKRDKMRVSNMAVELPLDVLAGPTFDGLDVITGAGEFAADQKSFQLWSLLLNHGYRVAATASSDACFDRPGGAVPGTARLYTFIEGGFSLAAAARAAAQGRTFVTTGPLLAVSVDGQPPGSSFLADGRPHEMRIEAWSSGAAAGGLKQVEILRNGVPFRNHSLDGRQTSFHTSLPIRESTTSWYCVRAFGDSEQRQRAISGALFFNEKPWRPPEPVRARIRVRVVESGSGRALDAALTEVSCVGTQPRLGAKHRLPGGVGVLAIPATSRLRADVAGFEPVTLSPFFDNPPLVETVTRLEDKDLLDWRTFERIQALLGDVALTFVLKEAGPR